MRVFEKFVSISGEVGFAPQGAVSAFIRFAGCNLKCSWCDTPESQPILSGETTHPYELLRWLSDAGCLHVVLTGGEPLLQEGLTDFIVHLLREGYGLTIETNGSFSVPVFGGSQRICWVVDHKLPSSGMSGSMLPASDVAVNIPATGAQRFIKFACADRVDFDYAKKQMYAYMEAFYTGAYAFSPVNPRRGFAHELAEWVIVELPRTERIVYNLQIHKYIGVA